jgi:hypothetical protein
MLASMTFTVADLKVPSSQYKGASKRYPSLKGIQVRENNLVILAITPQACARGKVISFQFIVAQLTCVLL